MSEKFIVECDFCGKQGLGVRDEHDRPKFDGFYRYHHTSQPHYTGTWIYLCQGCHDRLADGGL